jgi:peroxiredoxin
MQLIEEIRAMQEKLLPQIPVDTLEIMMAATEKLIASGIINKALHAGQQAPDFALSNTQGKLVSLAALLGKGPVVINFYRGSWCPYCNLELKAYQDVLPAIRDLGATLISISPNLLEKSAEFVAENPFSFDILSDEGNSVAREYGLVFTLAEELRPIYEQFGINIPELDGDDSYELPIPATYVVDADGLIIHAFVDADYTKRMEPNEVVDILKKHNMGN